MKKREPRFEVLWYQRTYTVDKDGKQTFTEDYYTKNFYTRKSAMKFYEAHKNDADKYGWWVTHRDAYWEIIEDIVY